MSNGALRAIVVANGALPDLEPFRALLHGADLVVAADGGARLLLQQQLPLTAVVGDMDSLSPHLLARWRARGGETVTVPSVKDETDLQLALTYARRHGAQRIVVLGALGGRADHALANVLLLAAPFLRRVEVTLLDTTTRVAAVRDEIHLAGEPGDLLTLLPLTARAAGIATQGLRYPLHDESLALGSPRGVSNVLAEHHAMVRVEKGVLLAVHTWHGARTLTWPSPPVAGW